MDLPSIEFSPLDAFSQAVQRWWLVALLTFLGGTLGWLYQLVQPPVYEARAMIVAQIDFEQTGKLTELEQDQAIGAVIALMTSSSVLDGVMAQVRERHIELEALVPGQDVVVERRRSQLELHYRHADPQVAAEVANLWAEQAYTAIIEAHRHAMQAEMLRQLQAGLLVCLGIPGSVASPGEACNAASPGEIEGRLVSLENEIFDETVASNAILPAMVFDFSRKADVPSSPVAFQSNLLVLGGSLVGFVCGVMLAGLRAPRR
jgi:uncharacterized protein involved in exopolysaccharide biosynthesis